LNLIPKLEISAARGASDEFRKYMRGSLLPNAKYSGSSHEIMLNLEMPEILDFADFSVRQKKIK
jgi:hypothetical protein